MSDKIFFRNYVLGGYPLLWVETYEEYRAMTSFLNEMTASKEKYSFFSWDRVDGIKIRSFKDGVLVSEILKQESGEPIDDPIDALTWAQTQMKDNGILFLLDYHHYIKKDAVCRKVRNLIPEFRARGKVLVVVSHFMDAPPELEKEITVVPFPLPGREDLKIVLKGICECAETAKREALGAAAAAKRTNLNPYPKKEADVIELIEAALGMTAVEAENAFSISLIEKQTLDAAVIRREKASVVRKTGLLEVLEVNDNIKDVGGLDRLKKWLEARVNCFSPEARKFGIVPPKGILLIGVPGTGKSLIARCIAQAWHRPLLRLDVGRIFGQYVGESEGNLRKCLHIAEAVAPDILFVDEIEKAFAGSKGDGDSGVTKRVLGSWLTWTAEKTADVFIVATANNIEAIPPEMIRSGRFDAIFWVDLPGGEQRKEIVSIHLGKVGRQAKDFDLDKLADSSDNFSGAEIEVWVKEALVRAYEQHQELKTQHLLDTAIEVTPIARIMNREIADARAWAKNHGVKYASSAPEVAVVATPGKRKLQCELV